MHPSLRGSTALANRNPARRRRPRALRPRPPSTPGGRPSLRGFGGGGGEPRSRVATSPAAAMASPPLSIRGDWGVLSTAAGRYAPSLLQSFLQMGPQGALGATKLLRPFSEIVDSLELKNPFVRNWIDLWCFLLAGVKSDGALSAEMYVAYAEGLIRAYNIQTYAVHYTLQLSVDSTIKLVGAGAFGFHPDPRVDIDW